MADTRRTVAALQALLANNVAGDISPQDVRDFLVSTSPAFGELYLTSAIETVISSAGVAVKALGTTAEVVSSSDVTVSVGNRLTYTAAPTIKAKVTASLSMQCAANSKNLAISFAKNGTQIANSVINRKVGTGTDTGAAALQTTVELAQNDYIELFVQNDDDTNNVTITKLVLTLESFLV